MTLLEQILVVKRRELELRQNNASVDQLAGSPHFVRATRSLREALLTAGFGIIAELKKASPSKGVIRPDFHPEAIARSYEVHGATAVSVLTDEQFFQGSLADLTVVRNTVRLPILRKDFIIDEYQLYEARAAGADAILLIAAALPPARVLALGKVAEDLHMGVLLEVHSKEELDGWAIPDNWVIGVNNRSLHTFETSLEVSFHLRSALPQGCVCISESGISTPGDLLRLREAGFHGALIGERLMREVDPGKGVAAFLEGLQPEQTR